MIYCFDTRSPWDYTKKEIAISKKNGNGMLYDSSLKKFIDYEGNIINIKDKLVFPRTGVSQIYDINNEIVNQGGVPVVSNEQINIIENWPNYYFDKRKSKIIKGYELIDIDIIKEIEVSYGQEIFIKTKLKNFSGIIPIELLLDKECAFYKTLLHHLDDDFIISKKVNIAEDEYGKKEYRCFVVNNEIYNISRFTTSILHNIDFKILNELQKIVENLKGEFPNFYVLDLFEYQIDGKNYIDIVEFNPIHSSGPYLYNSCIMKSDDILHLNLKKISYEFFDKIEEYTTVGQVFNDRSNLYDIPNSFSNHLRSICMNGNIGITWTHDFDICESDFARHNPIFDFSRATEFDDDFLLEPEESNLLKELSNKDTKKLEKLLIKYKA